MTDATARIKNLSIALEALSRIPNSTDLSYDIEKLLKAEIEAQKEENERPIPPARPAKSTSEHFEDIPF